MYRSKYIGYGGPIRTGFKPQVVGTQADWDRAAARSKALIEEQRRRNGDPEYWPKTRKLAIAFIARTENAKACIAKLSGSKTYAGQDDFLYLRQNGLAIKGERWHKLTPNGWKAAHKAIFALAKELGLHLPEYNFDSWYQHTVRCCCGFSGYISRRSNRSAASNLQKQFAKHLEDPDAWKRRKTVDQIVDEIIKAKTAPFRADDPDLIDRPDSLIYADNENTEPAFPLIVEECSISPSGQHAYDCSPGADPEVCIHCKRKT